MSIYLRNNWDIPPSRWGSDIEIKYAIQRNLENIYKVDYKSKILILPFFWGLPCVDYSFFNHQVTNYGAIYKDGGFDFNGSNSYVDVENTCYGINPYDDAGAAASNDGITTDGTYLYITYLDTIYKRDMDGSLVDSSNTSMCSIAGCTFGGLFYHTDGFLYVTLGKYTSPYEAYILKIDPSNLSCVTSYDISAELTYSANAIFYTDGYWFVGETADGVGVQKAIVKLNGDWTANSTVFTSNLAAEGWQDATLYEGKVYITDHQGLGVWVFRYHSDINDLELLYVINNTDYWEGIATCGSDFYIYDDGPDKISIAKENINPFKSYSISARLETRSWNYLLIGGGQDVVGVRYSGSLRTTGNSGEFGFDLKDRAEAQVRLTAGGYSLNKKYLLEGTYDEATARLYVDGSLKDTDTGVDGEVSDFAGIVLGRDISPQRYFNGIMYEVVISNTVQTDDQRALFKDLPYGMYQKVSRPIYFFSPTLLPTTLAPTTLAPTSLAPTTLAPTSLAPTTLLATTLPPTTLAPTTLEPTTLAPTTVYPSTVPPTTAHIATTPVPATLAPTSLVPTTLEPTTLAPTTLPPTTLAPTTLPPTSLAPTTLPATTLAPTTLAPTTLTPTTTAPTSLAPTTLAATTLEPTTLAPTTVAPTSLAPTTNYLNAYNSRTYNYSTDIISSDYFIANN